MGNNYILNFGWDGIESCRDKTDLENTIWCMVYIIYIFIILSLVSIMSKILYPLSMHLLMKMLRAFMIILCGNLYFKIKNREG